MKILFLDDLDQIRSLKAFFEAQNIEACEAGTVQEFAEQLRSGTDLIVANLLTRSADFEIILAQFDQELVVPSAPVMILTDQASLNRFSNSKWICDYLFLPFLPDDLLARVRWNLRQVRRDSSIQSGLPGQVASPCLSSSSSRPMGNKIVLIVEDDLELAQTLKLRVESGGYRVQHASDGEEAILKVRAQKPHLILMDVMMPKLDGYSTLKQVNQITDRKVPVMIMTGTAAISEEDYRMEGACAFFRKPVNGDELLKQMKETIGEA